jgi:hypothetical protein
VHEELIEMPTAELNEQDIIRALNYLTDDKFNINHIVNIDCINASKDDKLLLKIFWRP